MRPIARLALALPLVAAAHASACSSDDAPAGAGGGAPATIGSVPCRSSTVADGWDAFAADDVALVVEGDDPGLAIVRADLGAHLSTMWGAKLAATSAPAAGAKRLVVVASTSDAAQEEAALPEGAAYAIRRVDAASGTRVVVAARTPARLAHGVYALIEELGARFFHPKEDYLPRLDGPRVPRSMAIARTPAFADIGVQPHTLHPIEWFSPLHEPGADHLADAKRLVDWLVKTGQNRLQWPLVSTVELPAFAKHAKAIVDYAHARGVRVGPVVQMYGGSSLQNNYVLVPDAEKGPEQMDAPLDALLPIGWDFIELALGEFIGTDPANVVSWLDHATKHLAEKAPGVEVDVQNHVGNYPKLWVEYQGQKLFYYHLPQFCDERLGQSVHTLAFFDLYRDWATYKHPDFHLQREYILKVLPTRRVHYFPESSYWISADVDVPLFLPEFIRARYDDIHKLTAEVAAKKLPPLQAHITFTSGHEWAYWMTDYLAAKIAWQPEAPLSDFFAHVAGAFGECKDAAADALGGTTALQDAILFDEKLMAYVQGENSTVDVGYLAGFETHPRRIPFQDVLALSEGDRADFEAKVVRRLEDLAAGLDPHVAALDPRCAGADEALRPWCEELRDGVAIVAGRARHSAHLYRAILALAKGEDPEPDFAAAATEREAGLAVVGRREKAYRFDLEKLVGAYANPTVYPFGYLRPAHDLCYWIRQEQQVRSLVDDGAPLPVGAGRTCVGD